MNPVVSICIPTYKQTKYLKKCLESVLLQDFKYFELIISDDTPDDSIEVFCKSVLKDFNYSYFRNYPSLGAPENWNAAIQKAKGKYIKIMHHDDFFTQPNSLQFMVEEIEKQKASFLFCQTAVYYIKSNTNRINAVTAKQFNILKKKPELLFFKNIIGAPSTTLCVNNKSFIYDIRFKWLVDIDFYFQYLFNGHKIAHINKPLIATSHEIEGQVTGSVIDDKEIQIREHILLFNKIKNHINKNSNFASFFDYLFFKYDIQSYSDIKLLVPEADENKIFFNQVINDINKNRKWKWFKKRFFESRYNNYIFKLEQFI